MEGFRKVSFYVCSLHEHSYIRSDPVTILITTISLLKLNFLFCVMTAVIMKRTWNSDLKMFL